jgi:hypothetical protein
MASFGVGFLLIAACFVVARGLAAVYWPLRPPGPGWPGAGAAGDDREGLTRFQASILLAGRTAIGIQVPAELVEALGKGRRPPVHATVNGYTYRNTVPSMRGAFLLPVSAEVRERAGVATVGALAPMGEAFMLWFSAEVREVAVPPDLADALDRDLDARRALDALSYSGKQRLVLAVEQAKTAETRRRVARAVEELRAGRDR